MKQSESIQSNKISLIDIDWIKQEIETTDKIQYIMCSSFNPELNIIAFGVKLSRKYKHKDLNSILLFDTTTNKLISILIIIQRSN